MPDGNGMAWADHRPTTSALGLTPGCMHTTTDLPAAGGCFDDTPLVTLYGCARQVPLAARVSEMNRMVIARNRLDRSGAFLA